MKSLIPFFIGAALTVAICFFFNPVEKVTQINVKVDSLQVERIKINLKVDSLYLQIDSLQNLKAKNDTILITLTRNEKASINIIDSLPDSALIGSIRNALNAHRIKAN